MNNFSFYPYSPYYTRPNPYFPSRRSRPVLQNDPPVFSPKKTEERKENSNSRSLDDSKEDPIFEIFGISLFYDDILLICLIFFLYSEGIKDQYLFLSLVLLLLS